MGKDFRKYTLEQISIDPHSSINRKQGAMTLLRDKNYTQSSLDFLLKTTGQIKEKGKGIREDYVSPKYGVGRRMFTSVRNKSLRNRGIAGVMVEILNTYKTYSSSGWKNYTIHVKILEGEKKGKEYRLSNHALYLIEELT